MGLVVVLVVVVVEGGVGGRWGWGVAAGGRGRCTGGIGGGKLPVEAVSEGHH